MVWDYYSVFSIFFMSLPPSSSSEPARTLLRHAVATLAYRGGKAFRGAPEDFATFHVAEKSRCPGEILAHIGDLLDWALSLAKGKQEWHDSKPLLWYEGVDRFFRALAALDLSLASDVPLGAPAEKIFQGPIADALTHVGQISMLRRLAGSPVRGENYLRAEISAGRVGPEQSPPRHEFD
jgi:hypothetical protein